MAISPGKVSVTEGSGKDLDMVAVTTTAGAVQREVVSLGDPDASTPSRYARISAGGALLTDASATTQPVSVSSSVLPTGAATDAALQAIESQLAGTLSVSVVSSPGTGLTNAQLRATPVPVDASGTTVPVSIAGTVTVSNPSPTLATGAATAAKQDTGNTSLGSIDTKTPALVTGRVPVDGSGVTQPVSIAAAVPVTDNSGSLTVDDGGGSITVDGVFFQATQPVSIAATVGVNNTQVAGTAIDVNSGTKSAGTIRVVLATDQPQLTNKLLVTPDSVALPNNQSVNISQINGVTPLMGNGVTGTGSLRVTLASDQTALTNSLPVKLAPATAGGCSVTTVAASSTASSIKSSPGTVTAISIFNPNTAPIFLNFYDIASGSVTAGTSAQKACYGIPAGGAFNLALDSGLFSCATAISVAITTTDTGGTNPGSTARCTVHYV